MKRQGVGWVWLVLAGAACGHVVDDGAGAGAGTGATAGTGQPTTRGGSSSKGPGQPPAEDAGGESSFGGRATDPNLVGGARHGDAGAPFVSAGGSGTLGGQGGWHLGGDGGSADGGSGGAFPDEVWPRGPCLARGEPDSSYSSDWPGSATAKTVDKLTMKPWYTDGYEFGKMAMAASGKDYFLSDGSQWESGAGSASYGFMSLGHLSRQGSLIRYHMTTESVFVERTDYNSGNHGANYRLESIGDWVIEAEYGSSAGTLTAEALITMDEPANYSGDIFNYLSRPICSVVPVTITYTISGAFTETLFENPFTYTSDITVDLSNP
jgi:hypothetical protein